jgi:lysophospholipase L1-like esterase
MRTVIEEVVERRIASGDKNLSYHNGLEIFGEADAGDMPDDLHPNSAGYLRMGQRFHEQVLSGLVQKVSKRSN